MRPFTSRPPVLYVSAVTPRNPISGVRLRSRRRFRLGKRQRSRSNYVNPLARSRYISIPLFRFALSVSPSLSPFHSSSPPRVSKSKPRKTFSYAHNIKTLLRPFRFLLPPWPTLHIPLSLFTSCRLIFRHPLLVFLHCKLHGTRVSAISGRGGE